MPYTGTLLIAAPGSVHALETRIALPSESATHALIAPPHPSYGGSINNPVVEALEQAFWAHGLGTLALNFRGVGASSAAGSINDQTFMIEYHAPVSAEPATGWRNSRTGTGTLTAQTR